LQSAGDQLGRLLLALMPGNRLFVRSIEFAT
jgi:hypothetical protein